MSKLGLINCRLIYSLYFYKNENKIINKALCSQIRSVQKDSKRRITYSFQFCPYTPATPPGMAYSADAQARYQEMLVTCTPRGACFYGLTWHPRCHREGSFDVPPIRAAGLLRKHGRDVMFQITCENLTSKDLNYILALLKEHQICTLFCTRGNNYVREKSHFTSVANLIDYIKSNYGDTFMIGVPGLLNITPVSMGKLKDEVMSGADFVITQAFVDFFDFKQFIFMCQRNQLCMEIIPGLFVYDHPDQYEKYLKQYPFQISDTMKCTFDRKMKNTHQQFALMAKEILGHESPIKHIHFFTVDNNFDPAYNFVKKYLKELKC